MQPNWIEKLGGRKFIVTLYICIATTVLLYFKSIDQDTFKALMMGVPLIYVSGNVGQKILSKSTPTATTASSDTSTPLSTS
jgi:hypothetical protein